LDSDSAFIVISQPNREAVAATFLAAWGFSLYFPQVRVPFSPRHPAKLVDRPFLPRHMFVWDDGCSVARLKTAPGVSTLIRLGDQVARVGRSVLDAIRAREEQVDVTADGQPVIRVKLDEPQMRPHAFQYGESVRLNMETHSVNALFQFQIGEERAMVFMSMLGRLTRATVPLKDLERVA